MKKILTFILIFSLILFPMNVFASSCTFTYGSGTSKCISSSVSAKSNVNIWKITSSSSGKSKNTASATATAKHYYNNSVVDTVTRTVRLTCSSTGKFS